MRYKGKRSKPGKTIWERVAMVIFFMLCCAVFALLICILLQQKSTAVNVETAADPAEKAEIILPAEQIPAQAPMQRSLDAMARLVWGEARNCSTTEQAAVIWCVLNRVDSTDPYYPDSIYEVITQPGQFEGYHESNPIEDEYYLLAKDVLCRWFIEYTYCVGSVGRILPAEYLFFTGDGVKNTFTTEWRGGDVWDFSLPSPYEEAAR